MEIDSDSKESLQFDKSREIVGAESITESESDDLFNDNISVISDSLTSKNLKKYDMKKISATIQRLKQENASLRDSLDKINATDVALVRQKLRGANADIQRLKQLNAELKDRNQILEERLVNLLAEHSGGISAKAKLTSMAKQKHSPPPTPADAALTNEAVNQHETQSAGTSSVYFPSSGQHHALEEESRSLQKKLKHAERLLQSYEVKLRLLQVLSTKL